MTATTTPGVCSVNSGTRGCTGASSSLPTSSAASRSPGASLKNTVVAEISGRLRLLVSVTFQIPPLPAPGYAQRIELGDEGLGSRVRVASQVK